MFFYFYSCSKEANKEFPNMDPNIVSAISIARRLQDPLCEYVKIGPSHLGKNFKECVLMCLFRVPD